MNPKPLLALILSATLLGCSTTTRCSSDVPSPKVATATKVKLMLVKVDSEESNGQDGFGENAVDGNPNTYWHTQWNDASPAPPHEIIIQLLPPSTIKAFTYLPRQDASDHGTIKDYEFYVSDDGTNFGQPIKKGAFAPGKEEQIETFEPIKCRFIKLKAISEINGLPWTSAAEIRVIQNDEDASAKDYWQGNLGQLTTASPHSTSPDAIDHFVAALSAEGWMWINGADATLASQAATPEEVVSETLRLAKFEGGQVTGYHIVALRKVHIPDTYTAVLADTNLGQMIFLMQYIKAKDSTPAHWWRRIYDAHLPIKRLY